MMSDTGINGGEGDNVELNNDHKSKITRKPLISHAIKASDSFYHGTKAGFEVLEIKVAPTKNESLRHRSVVPGEITRSEGSFNKDLAKAIEDRPWAKYVTCLGDNGNDTTSTSPSDQVQEKGQKRRRGWFGRMQADLVYRGRFLKTLAIFWAFSVLGWTIGQFGPSFLDLQIITGSSLEEGTAFMTANSVGYLLGSLSSGLLFDRLNKLLLVLNPLSGLIVTVTIIPWCSPFGLMVFMHWIKGFCLGSIDAVSNALTVYVWGDSGRSFMQALHFSFAMGGIISPLATAPFLVHLKEADFEKSKQAKKGQTWSMSSDVPTPSKRSLTDLDVLSSNFTETEFTSNNSFSANVSKIYETVFTNVSVNVSVNAFESNNTYLNVSSKLDSNFYQNVSSLTSSINNSITMATDQYAPYERTFLEEQQSMSRLYISYLITTALGILAAIPFVVMYFKNIKIEMAECRKDEEQVLRVLPAAMKGIILLNMSLLLGTYSAIEDTFAGFLTTFSVRQMDWTKTAGSFATSVYWAAFGSGRFAGIFLVRFCSPVRIITMYSSLLMLAFVGLYFSAANHFDTGVWVCALLSGFALSVIFPTIFTWTEASLLPVDGKIASMFLVASSTGTMINPIVLGYLMDELTPMWFCYLLLGESISLSVLFMAALYTSHIVQQQTNNTLKCKNRRDGEEEEVEDSVVDKEEKEDLLEDAEKPDAIPCFCPPDKERAQYV